MELTIAQAIQHAISAHSLGDLQEAERLYRAVLQSQPTHPDANHNLGLIAISTNHAIAALPLFKAALKANPKIEQFWVSYIDALAKTNQTQDANKVLNLARNQGVSGGKLNDLEARLLTLTKINDSELDLQTKSLKFSEKRKILAVKKRNKKKTRSQNIDIIGPSETELNDLLQHYQNGRHSDAERLAKILTERFPNHQFSWKVLSTILGVAGRSSEALIACRKTVELSPEDPGAHNNLGNILKQLARSEEAAASYAHAISLEPAFADAYSNVGIVLKELGRYKDAEISVRQAIELKPEYAEAHYNLGSILQDQGKLGAAEVSYTQAIMNQPTYLEAHNSLLTCLYMQNKKAPFFKHLDALIQQDQTSAVIGSLTCRSALKYGIVKRNLFCTEPLEYVSHIDLNSYYDFEQVFCINIRHILKTKSMPHRKQSLLVSGYQTSGNLFDVENDFTVHIQKAIRLEIERYHTKFDSNEQGIMQNWPTEYSLYGWLISMQNGGEIKPHIHERGWLSGSIYINVPPKSKPDSGNLVVALGVKKDATDVSLNFQKTLNVVTGSLVLFPASLTHYTIPFEAEEDRIVLAFDVIKK